MLDGGKRFTRKRRPYKNCTMRAVLTRLAEIRVAGAAAIAVLLGAGLPAGATPPGGEPVAYAPEASPEAPEGAAGAGGSASRQAEPVPLDSRFSMALLGSYRKSMEIEIQIQRACDTYAVPLVLARAVCMYESGANDNLTSGAGAHGYFQVMPATFRLLKVDTNIEAGVKYLSWLLRDYGREDDALAAYNGGPRRLRGPRPLPIETLQYVVGVGTYRTLLTREEGAIRADASRLLLHTVVPDEDWASISALTGIPVIELRMYNAYLALRPLRPGNLIAYPEKSEGPILIPHRPGESGPTYLTRRGDNYLMLAFAFGVDLDRFRADNALWRVQVPLEGMRLVVSERQDPKDAPQAAAAVPEGSAPAGAKGAGPAGAGSTAPSMPLSASAATPSEPGRSAVTLASPTPLVHKVKRGETLSGIATRYDVTPDAIRAANKLPRQARIVAGQILKIPLEATQ